MSDRDRLSDTLARALGTVSDPLRLAHDRIAALEAECAWLRRERDALRLACQALITDGTDLARLVERARSLLGAFDGGRGAEVDPALLAWARCVVAARGAVDGAE